MEKKKTFMVSAIIVIMIVLFGVWIFNLRNFIRPGSSTAVATDLNLSDAQSEFSKSMSGLEARLESLDKSSSTSAETSTSANLKNFSNSLASELGATTSSSTALTTSTKITTSSSAVAESAELQALKAKIDALNKKLKPLK